MRKAEKIYTTVLFCEGIVLLISCVLSLVWLWRLETEQRGDLLHGMFIGTLVLSLVLIPVESVLFVWYRKRSGLGAFQPVKSTEFVLKKLPSVFAVLWFVHMFSMMMLADLHQWKNGSDIYMLHSRPGSRMIFLSFLGMLLPQWIVRPKKN